MIELETIIPPAIYACTMVNDLNAYYAMTGQASILDGDARTRAGR